MSKAARFLNKPALEIQLPSCVQTEALTLVCQPWIAVAYGRLFGAAVASTASTSPTAKAIQRRMSRTSEAKRGRYNPKLCAEYSKNSGELCQHVLGALIARKSY